MRPSADELRRQAARCRALLSSSVVDFYLPHALDREHFGYLQDADGSGTFLRSNERFLSLQARQLWLFSTLAAEGVEVETTLAAAHVGHDSVGRFRDREKGGYYSKMSVDGTPIDPRKEICLNSFALYALSAYHRATGVAAVLDEARELFYVLEAHAHDDRYGGYHELFEANWTPITDQTVRGYWARGGTKTQNGHMHMLEAMVELLRVWPDSLVERRVLELATINTTSVRHPGFHCNVTRWTPDWRLAVEPPNRRATYGHDLEAVWLTLDAVRAAGWSEHVIRSWAEAICGYSLEHGYDTRHGGFYREGAFGRHADDHRKEWWVQAEALVAMLELFALTSDGRYYDAFAGTLDFVERHQVARGSGWWSMRSEDGSPHQLGTLGSEYQDGYHSGRALLRCERLLNQLSG